VYVGARNAKKCQKAMGDTAGFDLQPRHLLYASSAAVEKDFGGPDIH
jgi:hypothetical protein